MQEAAASASISSRVGRSTLSDLLSTLLARLLPFFENLVNRFLTVQEASVSVRWVMSRSLSLTEHGASYGLYTDCGAASATGLRRGVYPTHLSAVLTPLGRRAAHPGTAHGEQCPTHCAQP